MPTLDDITAAPAPLPAYRRWLRLACLTALGVFGLGLLIIIAIAVINYKTVLRYPNILSPNKEYIFYGLGEWLLYTGAGLASVCFILVAIAHLRQLKKHKNDQIDSQFILQQSQLWRFTAKAIWLAVLAIYLFSVLGWYNDALQAKPPRYKQSPPSPFFMEDRELEE